MPKQSAGILLYKKSPDGVAVLLAHPGGPYWKNKDQGVWSIPKGEFEDGEKPLDAALREFKEETGIALRGDFLELDPIKLKSGKTVYAWALEMDVDAGNLKSNTFALEWPPKSGKMVNVPENDRAEWFPVAEALEKINPAQAALVHQLTTRLSNNKH